MAVRVHQVDRQRNLALLALGGLLLITIAAAGLRSWLKGSTQITEPVAPAPAPLRPGYFPRVTLRGPDGAQTIPSPDGPTVVNVWLQGCEDCMPAFEAMRHSRPCNGRVVNVAYGEATTAWAEEHGVRTNLVVDRTGSQVVRPLGVSSFTTFVVSRSGEIVLRERPDSATYRAAISPYCEK